MKKPKKDTVLNKPNNIIEAHQNLSANQQKVFFSIWAQFAQKVAYIKMATYKDYYDFVNTKYSVYLPEIIPNINNFGVGEKSRYLINLKKEMMNLLEQKHFIETGRSTIGFNLIDFVEVHFEKNTVEVKMSNTTIDIIMEGFRNGYTQIFHKEIIPLKSKYSIRIFEILIRRKEAPGIKEAGYTVLYSELRKLLGIADNEYKEYYNFDSRVLQHAQHEILKKTCLRFAYNKTKNEKQEIQICFYDIVYNVKEILPDQIELFEVNDETIRTGAEKISMQKEAWDKDREEEEYYIDSDGRKYRISNEELPFLSEKEMKINQYLEGLFPDEILKIKTKHSFEYIEFYYKIAIEKNAREPLKNFPGYLAKLLQYDKQKFHETQSKNREEEKLKAIQEKNVKQKKSLEKKLSEEKKLAEKEKCRKLEKVFESIPNDLKEKYLQEYYTKNPFGKSDSGEIYKATKWDIAQQFLNER